MEVITLRFQMALQWTATKVTKHGKHQDYPGRITANTHNSSVQADAFPALVLSMVERRSPLLAIQKVQQLPITFEDSQLSSHASSCCPHVQTGGKHFTEQHDPHLSYRQEHIQLWRDAQEWTHSMEGMVWTDCWAARVTCVFVLQAKRECFCETCTYSCTSSVPVILALSFVFWGRETAWSDTQMLSLN